MLACEECGNWLHSKCVGLSRSVAATFPFVCPFCLRDLHRQVASLRSDQTQVSDSVCSLTKSVELSQQSVLVKDELASIRQSLEGISSRLHSLTTSSSTSSTSTIRPPSPDNSFLLSGRPPRAPPPLPPPPLCPSTDPPPSSTLPPHPPRKSALLPNPRSHLLF